MMMGSIPVATIVDLAGMAELVKELKAGKAAEMIVELRDQMKALQSMEKEQTEQLTEINDKLETLSTKEKNLSTRETRLSKDREALRTEKANAKGDLVDVAKTKEEVGELLRTTKHDAIKTEREWLARLSSVEHSEKRVAQLQIEAENLKKEYEDRITRAKEMAASLA